MEDWSSPFRTARKDTSSRAAIFALSRGPKAAPRYRMIPHRASPLNAGAARTGRIVCGLPGCYM